MTEYDYYDSYDRSGRGRSSRETRTREPEYVSETFVQQRGPTSSRDLVYRHEDSVEEISRPFPPPGGAEYGRSRYREDYPPRRARSARDRRGDYYDDDYDEGPAIAGAAAGYAIGRSHRGRHDDDDSYYSDEYGRRPRRKERRKSQIEEALEGLGLGGAAATVTKLARSMSRGGQKSRHRSRSGRRHDSSSDDDDYGHRRSSSRDMREKWKQAAKAAVLTGITQAVRVRKEPGDWMGAKGGRVATAALSAAGIDAFLDKNPEKKSKRHIVESVVAGLAADRLANGKRDSSSRGRSQSRSRSRSRSVVDRIRDRSRSIMGRSPSRSRSRSRGRNYDEDHGSRGRSQSRLRQIATVGGIAAAGKAGKSLYDRLRSKSRGRDRSRSADTSDSRGSNRKSKYSSNRSPGRNDPGRGRRRGGAGSRDSSLDSASSEDLEKKRKEARGKELLTAGLATVATIHAAHGVYSSMEAAKKRHQLVQEGEMSPQEAKMRKSKNILHDAAAVGIAALGIKSAFAEWKDLYEHRSQIKEIKQKRQKYLEDMNRRRARSANDANSQSGYPGPQGMYGAPPHPTSYPDGNPGGFMVHEQRI
ncbi:hypothetical protein EJ06DRAFT_555809 [Trichodelitschia bisporula]|uniref:DUF3824 domain-containing protein n=1 Tax=Trichodelitschia bisporula TaxID=703511 RepID=A0A6G1HYS5_9PEZI|nr:hypothetical protein EJ06DRAFT_555809 [Trichodelitschia bisporula]